MLGTRSKPIRIDFIKSFLAIAIGNMISVNFCLAVDIPPYSTVCADKGAKYDAIKQDCVCPDGEVIQLHKQNLCNKPDIIDKIYCTTEMGTWNTYSTTCSCPENKTIKYKTQKCQNTSMSINDFGGYLLYNYTSSDSTLKITRLDSSVMSVNIGEKCYNLKTTSSLVVNNINPPMILAAHNKTDCSNINGKSIIESGTITCLNNSELNKSENSLHSSCKYTSDSARPCIKPISNEIHKCMCGDNKIQVELGMSCPSKCGNPDSSNSGTCTCPDGSSISINEICPSFKPKSLTKEECTSLSTLGYTWDENEMNCQIPETTSSKHDQNNTTSSTNDQNKTTSLTNEPNKTTSLTNDQNKTTSLTNEPNKTTSLTNEPNKTTSLTNEPNKTTSLTNEPNKTTSLTNEPNKTTSLTNDQNKTTSLTNDQNKTTSLTNDQNKTTSLTNNPNKTTSLTNNPNKCNTPLTSSPDKCLCKNSETVPINTLCQDTSTQINSTNCSNIPEASWNKNNHTCTCINGFEIKNIGEHCPLRCSTPSKNDPSKCECKDGTKITLDSTCPAITTCSEQLGFPLVNTIPTFLSDKTTSELNSTNAENGSVAYLSEGAMVGAPFMVLAKGGKVICDTHNKKESYNYKINAEILFDRDSTKIIKPAFFLGSIGTDKCKLNYFFSTSAIQEESNIERNCGCGNVWAVKFTPEKKGRYHVKFISDSGSEDALAKNGTLNADIDVLESQLTDSDHKSESFYRKGILRSDSNGLLSFNKGKEYFVPVGLMGPNKDITTDALFPYLLLMINGKACTLFDYVRMLSAQGYNIATFFPEERMYSVTERLAIYNLIEYMQSQGIAAYIELKGNKSTFTRESFALYGHNNAILWANKTETSFNAQNQPILKTSGFPKIKSDNKITNAQTLINSLKDGFAGIMANTTELTPWLNKNTTSQTDGLVEAMDVSKSTSYALSCIHSSQPAVQVIKANACKNNSSSCVRLSSATSSIEVKISTETGEVTPLPGGSCEETEVDTGK